LALRARAEAAELEATRAHMEALHDRVLAGSR